MFRNKSSLMSCLVPVIVIASKKRLRDVIAGYRVSQHLSTHERMSAHAVFCMHGSYVALEISTNSGQAEEVLQEVQ